MNTTILDIIYITNEGITMKLRMGIWWYFCPTKSNGTFGKVPFNIYWEFGGTFKKSHVILWDFGGTFVGLLFNK